MGEEEEVMDAILMQPPFIVLKSHGLAVYGHGQETRKFYWF